jgi:ATPase family associated with various cellular activities (AAA)/CHAT domain
LSYAIQLSEEREDLFAHFYFSHHNFLRDNSGKRKIISDFVAAIKRNKKFDINNDDIIDLSNMIIGSADEFFRELKSSKGSLVLDFQGRTGDIPVELLIQKQFSKSFLCLEFPCSRILPQSAINHRIQKLEWNAPINILIIVGEYKVNLSVGHNFREELENLQTFFSSNFTADQVRIETFIPDSNEHIARKLSRAISRAHIVHFIGHSKSPFHKGDEGNWGWDFSKIQINTKDLIDTRLLQHMPHLVFSNSCYSSLYRVMPIPSTGFPWGFIQSGVDNYIGCWGLVEYNDQSLMAFSRTFYESLLIDKNSIGEAIRSARLHCQENFPDGAWYQYQLFGHPDNIYDISSAVKQKTLLKSQDSTEPIPVVLEDLPPSELETSIQQKVEQSLPPVRFIAFQELLKSHMMIGRVLIEVLTTDEDEVLGCIQNLCRDESWDIFDFSRTEGLCNVSYETGERNPIIRLGARFDRLTTTFINIVNNFNRGGIVVFRIDECTREEFLALKELSKRLRTSMNKPVCLVIVCRVPITNRILERELLGIDFPMPQFEEIYEMLVANEDHHGEIHAPEEESKFEFFSILSGALSGLTRSQISTLVGMARAGNENKVLDHNILPFVHSKKRKLLQQYLPLHYQDWTELTDSRFVGCEVFRTWLMIRQQIIDDIGSIFIENIAFPKGILIHGPSGVGKTEAACEVARLWQLPLIQLDLNNIYSSPLPSAYNRQFLREDEGTAYLNLRRCFWMAEQSSPCVLLLENLDKHFGTPEFSIGGEQSSSGGSQSHLLAYFLNWMQENISPVFVVGTALNVDVLNPEIWRRGRFDQVFHLGTPTVNLRQELLHEFLKRKGIDVSDAANAKLEEIARQTKSWTAAELKSAVDDALIRLFIDCEEEQYDNQSLKVLEKLEQVTASSSPVHPQYSPSFPEVSINMQKED